MYRFFVSFTSCGGRGAQICFDVFPMVQLVTWELTLAHGCPWEWVESAWFAQPTEKSAFLRRISGFTHALMRGGPLSAHGFLIPDPLAVAVALRPAIVTASALSHATVELGGARQSIYDFLVSRAVRVLFVCLFVCLAFVCAQGLWE